MDFRTTGSVINTFAIDVWDYVVMFDHSHIVLKINAPLAQSWPDENVIQRWEQIFSIPILVEYYLNGQCQLDAELKKAKETITRYRE